MSWCNVALAILGAGCSAGVEVDGESLPDIVAEYRRTGWVEVTSKDGTTQRFDRSDRPLLHLPGTYCPQEWKPHCISSTTVELERVRVVDDTLHLPDGQSQSVDRVHAPRVAASPETLRHRAGLQIGGTGFLQVIYRYRMLGPLSLDVGFYGVPHAVNGSAGLLLEGWLGRRLSLYVGAGAGGAMAFGDASEAGCDPNVSECEIVSASTAVAFGHARVGLAIHLGSLRRYVVALDGGLWWGSVYRREAGVTQSESLLWPMGGLAFLRSF